MDPLNRLRRRMSKLTPPHIDEPSEPTSEEVCREITAINKQQSTFLRLPVSLRERMYRYVLGGTRIRVCDTKNCDRHHRCRTRARKFHYATYFHLRRRRLTLLVTCRQIHNETKLLPFSLNEFDGHHWDMQLAVYYRLTDAQVSAMTNIRVYFTYEDLIYYPALGQQGSSVNLSKHLMATLKVLGLLRGLRRITLEWAGWQNWEDEWPMVEGRVYFLITEELKQIRGVSNIKVSVLGGKGTTGLDVHSVPVVDDTQGLVTFTL